MCLPSRLAATSLLLGAGASAVWFLDFDAAILNFRYDVADLFALVPEKDGFMSDDSQ